jgi:1,2-diacylglycerol 3-beta-galactosyltransferase
VTGSPPGRVLLLHSATGNGHRSVAQAIQDSIAEVSNVKCWEIEVFAGVKPPLIGSWPAVYSWLATRLVWLYNIMFRLTDTYRISSAMSRVIYRLAEPEIKAILLDIDPDVVVATSPFVSQIAAQARRDLRARFGIVNVVSDLVTPHASWVCGEADVTVACSPFAKSRLLRKGMQEQKMVETAFPVQCAFRGSNINKEEFRRELGLNLELFTITLSGGSLGSGPVLSCAKALNKAFPDAQLLIVAGHNGRLYDLLKSQFRDVRNRVYGFTEQIPTLLGASDVVVSKAGPSSIMEACAVGRPVVVIDEVGLQEKGNGNLVQHIGIGYNAETVSGMIKIVESLKHSLEVTGEECNPIYIVDGSREIARIVLECCASQ